MPSQRYLCQKHNLHLQGRGLGFQETQALSQMGYDVSTVEPGTDKSTQRLQRRKWGPMAGLQQHNAAVVRPRPKNDVHGLGYDPYADADEFRVARKLLRDGPGVQPQRDRQGTHPGGPCISWRRASHKRSHLVHATLLLTHHALCGTRTLASHTEPQTRRMPPECEYVSPVAGSLAVWRQQSRSPAGVRKRGVAFAASILEESDVFGGDLADYVDEDEERANLHFEVVSSDDEAAGRGGAAATSPRRIAGAAPVQLLKARQGTMGLDSFIEGFERGPMEEAAVVESTKVPARGIRRTFHRFARPCGRLYGGPRRDDGVGRESADATAEPPADPDAKRRIDVMAATVARGGDEMLEFVRGKHQGALLRARRCDACCVGVQHRVRGSNRRRGT